jgi:hypothetical protein
VLGGSRASVLIAKLKKTALLGRWAAAA